MKRDRLSSLPFGISVLLGMLSCALLIALIANLGQIVKWAGYALLWIPSKIGVIRIVSPAEVIPADFSTNPSTVTFLQPGAYNLYTNNLDLLELADTVDESSPPWLVLQPMGDEEASVLVRFITRGLVPYDTPFASGRPIFHFVIGAPGAYTVRHPSRPTMVYFVPDYSTGRERTLVGLMVFELLVTGLILGSSIRGRWKARSQAARLERQQKRARADAFWQEYRSRGAHKPEQIGRKKRW